MPSDESPSILNKTYPLPTILAALSDYHLGYSLEMAAARLRKKTGRHVSPSTIMSWLYQYRRHCTYRRLRADGLRRFLPEETIRSIKLYHRQGHRYSYHRTKGDFVRGGTLGAKRKGDTRLAPVPAFFEGSPHTCPP